MTRLQKKCFVLSAALHGLLAAIVFVSSAFRTKPETEDLHVLNMIPANLLDRVGSGGGAPATAAHRAPAPAPTPAPAPEPVARVETPKPKVEAPEPIPEPTPRRLEAPAKPVETTAAQRPAKPVHEIHVSYATASNPEKHKKPAENADASQSSSAAEKKRLRRQVEASLSQLASGVESSGAEKTTVDVPGPGGGGDPFANYKDAVYTIYCRAWITQDSVADGVAIPVARIEVARDGTIRTAELVTPSGDPALDKSVERALRAVPRLPPFPAGSHDEQRVFKIRFSLDAKKASG